LRDSFGQVAVEDGHLFPKAAEVRFDTVDDLPELVLQHNFVLTVPKVDYHPDLAGQHQRIRRIDGELFWRHTKELCVAFVWNGEDKRICYALERSAGTRTRIGYFHHSFSMFSDFA
jgi:hypothetical protein